MISYTHQHFGKVCLLDCDEYEDLLKYKQAIEKILEHSKHTMRAIDLVEIAENATN